jgi:type IV pilus assembly protein PilA
MFKKAKVLKNEKGLTLIELLAVMVILGIIAAIAIPAIGGIIQNSREDAVKSDAIAILEAAKLAVASNDIELNLNDTDTTNDSIEVQELVNQNYVEYSPKDPSNSLLNATISYDPVDTDQLAISGTALAGDKTVTFTDATIADINNEVDGAYDVSE